MTRMHKATQLMWIERSSKCMGRAGADREVVLEECSSVRGFWDEHRHDDGLSWSASWNAPRPENSGFLPQTYWAEVHHRLGAAHHRLLRSRNSGRRRKSVDVAGVRKERNNIDIDTCVRSTEWRLMDWLVFMCKRKAANRRW